MPDRDWVGNETVLSGDIGTPSDQADNAFRVVIGVGDNDYLIDEHTVLDEVTITGGNVDASSVIQINGQLISVNGGGGVFLLGSSPTLSHVIINGNTAVDGGGIFLRSASPRLTQVVIAGNAANDGGGIYNWSSSPQLTNVVVSGNTAAAEPVMVSVRVVDPASEFPVRVHPAVSPNGDGINEFLMIEGIRDYRENRVKIFNRNGTIVWEASGYDNDRLAFRGMGTSQQRLPIGTYFYLVEIRNGSDWQRHSGYFVLRY